MKRWLPRLVTGGAWGLAAIMTVLAVNAAIVHLSKPTFTHLLLAP